MREKFDRKKGHINIGEIGKDKLYSMTLEERKKHLKEIVNYLRYTSTPDDVPVVDYKPLDVDIRHNTK